MQVGVLTVQQISPLRMQCANGRVFVQVSWTAAWTPVRGTAEVRWCARTNWACPTCGASSAGGAGVGSLEYPEFIHR